MLEKMLAIGNRWQKNGMDRVYINTDKFMNAEYNGITIQNYFNRAQKNSLKVYYDVVKDEIVVTTGDESAKKAVIETLMSL